MSGSEGLDRTSRLEADIEALESRAGADETPLSDEEIGRIQSLIAEMERIVSGNSPR